MSSLVQYYPGDRSLEFLLVVTLGITLASSAAWVISRRLADRAALRHLILFSALIYCLASPAVVWFCAVSGLTLVAIPVLRGEQGMTACGLTTIETTPRGMMLQRSDQSHPVAEEPVSPHTQTTIDQSADVEVTRVAEQIPTTSRPSFSDVPRAVGPVAATPWLFRGIMTGAMFVWATGALLMGARLVWNCGRAVQLRRTSRPLQSGSSRRLLQEVADQLGARQIPRLLVSSRAVAPLAVGFGQPAIILPERLLGAIRDDELRDVLTHELAHLLRGDQRIVLLQELAGALYWPIVSVHSVNRELMLAREEICDNVVLASRDAISYGETLLHVADLLVSVRQLIAAVGMISGQGELERRIASLIDTRRNTRTTTSRQSVCLVMFMLIAWSTIASATRFATSATAAGIAIGAVAENPTENCISPDISAVSPIGQSPPAAESERTVVLHGKVLGPGDRPIAGARLYLNIDEWTDPADLGTSDINGSYRLVVSEKVLRRTVAPGFQYAECQASVIATAADLGPGWAELPANDGGRLGEVKPEYAHDLHMVPDFPIVGRIVDAGGKPVAGASVAVERVHDLADRRWYKMHAAIQSGDPGLMSRPESDPNNWFTALYPTAWRMIPPGTTDSEGRFRIAGIGGDRAIRLVVSGPGIRSATVSVLTRDDVADFTQKIRAKYPRTLREPDGYFYPPRKGSSQGDSGVLLFGPTPTIEVDPARTIAGVVRDASTREPIAGLHIKTAGFYGEAVTDSHGRYRVLRVEDEPSILVYTQADPERYLDIVRRYTDSQGLGEIVADFDIPRGVVINGRVLESGTVRPIVSGPRQGCHDTVPGPLLAGHVFYFPLSTNTALRGAPTGLYFEGFPTGTANYYVSASIGGDGRFRIAVPSGPGVLLVQSAPGFPELAQFAGVWKENAGLHRLAPYTKLATRERDDGAPQGDAQSLPGFTGPIPITDYHSYRVINPPVDAKSIDLILSVPRAPSRVLRFVGPNGRAISGVKVQGLTAPRTMMVTMMTIVLDGSEAEVLALEPGKPREVIALSNDGKYTARTFVNVDDPQSRTMQLEPAGSVSGRLVDASTGLPLAGYSASITFPNAGYGRITDPVKTDAEGRFLIGSLIPGLGASISFQEPIQPFISVKVHQPDSLQKLVVRTGEVRDVGDIRIKPSDALSKTIPGT